MLVMLGACVSTQITPVAPNVVQINTQAKGLLFRGRATPEMMATAARETLARGYTHFTLNNVSSGQGSEVIGSNTYSSGQLNGISNTNFNGNNDFSNSSYNYNGYSSTGMMRRHTEANSVTVIMYHSNEAKGKNAFSAQDVLAQNR